MASPSMPTRSSRAVWSSTPMRLAGNQIRQPPQEEPQLDVRPFFIAIGQAINDNGGRYCPGLDRPWRCRSTGNVEGELGDGEFFIPKVSGIGFPCNVSGLVNATEINGSIYDFVYRETSTTITGIRRSIRTAGIRSCSTRCRTPVARSAGGVDHHHPSKGTDSPGITSPVTVGVARLRPSFEVNSPYQLTLITPAHTAGAAQVVITNASGSPSTGALSTTPTA